MLDRPRLVLAAVLAVLGFLLVTATTTGRQARVAEAPGKARLVRLIGERQGLVDDLGKAVDQLRREVTVAQKSTSRLNAHARATTEASNRLAEQAGTVALQGRGVVVTLSPSNRQPPTPEEAGAYTIHDSDVQLVVNALFAAGAEAVAVNDNRLVATTPIRAAGDTIIVNFRPLTPPFRIVAIGPQRSAFDSSDIAARFRRWSKVFGLGFAADWRDRVTVPAFTGRVALTAAAPLGE